LKLIIATFILFLLAFAGLACGLLLKRRGLRGGCHSNPGDHACQCTDQDKSAFDSRPDACCRTGKKEG